MPATYTCDYCGDEIHGELYFEAVPIIISRRHEIEFYYHRGDCLDAVAEHLQGLSGQSRRKSRRQEEKERFARADAWQRLTTPQRESMLLRLLGGERRTIAELTKQMQADRPDCQIWESNVRSLVGRMLRAGILDRTGEPNRRGHTRYRYFSSTRLEGPIVDLQAAFDSDDGAVA